MSEIIKNIGCCIFAGILIAACGNKHSVKDADYANFAEIAVESMKMTDEDAIDFAEKEISRHRAEFDAMATVTGLERSGNVTKQWLESPAIRYFGHDVDSVFTDHNKVAEQISGIMNRMSDNGLKIPVGTYATVIWSRPQSIIFADSVMLIALNHYLGSEHPSYSSLPVYRRHLKTPEMLPYDVAEALVATAYPFEERDSTAVINRLVYEGALIMAKMQSVKGATLENALGYTCDELKWLENNERELWHKMLLSHMIFDRSESLTDRLVSPAPFTGVLSSDVPGRAGRYIGYKIIETYIKSHSGVKITDLLSPEFYGKQNPLTDAGYNP